MFGLGGAEHRRRRKRLAQPFHASNMRNYEAIVEEETLRDMAGWPEGREFKTLDPMKQITLNVILRAVFGAEGTDFDELRGVILPWARLARGCRCPCPGAPMVATPRGAG